MITCGYRRFSSYTPHYLDDHQTLDRRPAIPADWECPDCGVAKADFEMVQL